MDRLHAGGEAGGKEAQAPQAQRSLSQILTDTWAQARYDLRLTEEEFWRLTPRLFHLLWERHRERIIHTELLHAWTTAAIINFSGYGPEKPVPESTFIPNRRTAPDPESEGEPIGDDEMSAYRSKVANLAALLERYQNTGIADPQLVSMGLVSANG